MSTIILVGKSVPLNPDRTSRTNRSSNSSRGSSDFNLYLDHDSTAAAEEEDDDDNNDDVSQSSSVIPSSAPRKKKNPHHHHSSSASIERYIPNGSKSNSVTMKAMNKSDLDNKNNKKYQLQVGSGERIITDSLTSADTQERADETIVSASSSSSSLSMMIFNDSQSLEPSLHSNSIMIVDATATTTTTAGKSTHHPYPAVGKKARHSQSNSNKRRSNDRTRYWTHVCSHIHLFSVSSSSIVYSDSTIPHAITIISIITSIYLSPIYPSYLSIHHITSIYHIYLSMISYMTYNRGHRARVGLNDMTTAAAAADDNSTVYSTESDRMAAQNSLFRATSDMDSVNDYLTAMIMTNGQVGGGGGGGGCGVMMSDTSSGSETTSRLSDAAMIDQNEVDSRVRRAEARPVSDSDDDDDDDDEDDIVVDDVSFLILSSYCPRIFINIHSL